MLTTNQAAIILGLSPVTVRAMITKGQLTAVKHGRDWLINQDDLLSVSVRRPRGWEKGRKRK